MAAPRTRRNEPVTRSDLAEAFAASRTATETKLDAVTEQLSVVVQQLADMTVAVNDIRAARPAA
jgi:hypothetical protein